MTDDKNVDARLAALLAAPPAPPDEAFVARVARAVLVERRIDAARKAMWRRFAIEAAASGSVVAAFLLLGRLAPLNVLSDAGPLGPAAAAVIVLALWFGVVLRPAATGR